MSMGLEKTIVALGYDDVSLDSVYNKKTGRYIIPINPNQYEVSNIKSWHEAGYTGKGVRVAIFDTGIMTNHPLIEKNIIKSIDFTGEGIEDLSGHGTLVTLILLGILPSADLFIVKVLDKNRAGFEKHIIEGIRWCIENNVKTVNFSFGQSKECSDDCKLKKELDLAIKNGIIFFASAGKDTNCPAQCCISVGALDHKCQNIADYSGEADFYQSGTIALYEVEIRNRDDWEKFVVI